MKIESLPLYLTEEQVAKLLSISKSVLQKHRHQRKGLPFSRHGRSVRYSLDDVLAYMASNRNEESKHV